MHGPAGQRLVVTDPSDKSDKLRHGWSVVPENLEARYEAQNTQAPQEARPFHDDAKLHGQGKGEESEEEGEVDTRMEINSATKTELSKTLGLPISAISKIVEARQVKKFTSIEELKELVPSYDWYGKAVLYKL